MLEPRSTDSIASSFSRYCSKGGFLDAEEVDSRCFSLHDFRSDRSKKDHVRDNRFNSLYAYGNQKQELVATIQYLYPLHKRILRDAVPPAGTVLGSYDPQFLLPETGGPAVATAVGFGTIIMTPHRPADPVAKFLDSLC